MIEVQAPDGRVIEIEGDKIPSSAELDNIFKATGTTGKPMSQSVMDNDDGKVYNVPLGMDGISTRYAIETQHKGADRGSFFGKVMAMAMPKEAFLLNATQATAKFLGGDAKNLNELGDRFEKNWRAVDRAVVEHAGELTDTFLAKAYHYQDKMKRLEKLQKGDFSDYGEDLTDDEKNKIKQTYTDKVEFVKKLRERNKAFWDKGAQILLPDEKIDNMSNLMMGLSSGALSVAEATAATVATKNPWVGSAIISGIYAQLKETEYFDKALESGTEAETASRDAKIAGAIEGGIELVGDRLLMGIGKIPQIQAISKRVIESAAVKAAQEKLAKKAVAEGSKHLDRLGTQAVKGFLTEGGEEGTQQSLGMIWENITGVSDYSAEEILGETLWASAIGGITGSGFGVMGTSVHNREVRKTNEALKQVLSQSNPELKGEELQKTADFLQEALYQENASYTQELNTLLEKELQPDTMPEGLTAQSLAKETRKLLKENYGMSDEEIDKTINASLNFIDARNQFNEAYMTFRDGLEKTGMNEAVADGEARLLSARALSIARAEKTDVKSVIDRWGLRFERTSFAEFQKRFADKAADSSALDVLRQDINRLKKGVSRKTNKGLRLSQFIKQKGGIKDDRGDIKSMGASVGLLNKNGISLDEATRMAWDAGYIQGTERPEINQLLDLLSDDLGNRPVYAFDDQFNGNDRQYYLELERALDEAGADINKDSIETIKKKLDDYSLRINKEPELPAYNPELDDFIPFQESLSLAKENERLDDIYPAYEGETITINGQEKTVYNSNGDRIAKSKEALENFYRWFGDSKVVDEQGRPLVVYHGTDAEFNEFKKEYAKDRQYKKGFFFTSDKPVARMYGDIIMPVYLKAETDYRDAKKTGKEIDYIHPKNDTRNIYVVFEPNQIKSTSNRGTYSESENNIYYQFAGENAQTAALDELNRAKQLEAGGVDNEEIRQQTGWFKGADGKWRFEINDKDATINRQVLKDIGSIENLRAERDQLLDDIETFKKEREKNNDAYPDGYLDELISQRYDKIEKIDYDIDHGYVSSAKTTLGELLNHDKLYDAYPSLRYMPVTMRTSDDLSGGAYSRKDNTIYLDSRLSDDEIKSILMHEIQHVIQEKENFARGGNIQFAKDYKKIIEKKASAEFMDLLDKKMKEGLERELKEYNLNKEAIVEILDAYSDYTKKFFDTDVENEEVNKAEKKYYETLEKHKISSDILENAMNNLRDQGIWKEAENEVKSKNKLSDADAYEIYRAFFGEVEARNTQARMDLTEEERQAKTPESTQDIANADALIVMPDGTAMAYKPDIVKIEIKGDEFGEYDGNDKKYIKKAKNWYKENLYNKPAFSPVIGKVDFFNRQFSETKDKNIKNIENLKYLPAVRMIIEQSTNVEEETPFHARKDDIVKFYRITEPVSLGGKVNNVSVLVAEDKRGNKYYNLDVIDEKSPQNISEERENEGIKTDKSVNINISPSTQNVNRSLYQDEQSNQAPRGAFYDRVIYLFERADASTVIHEMAHFFLDDMRRFSDNETTAKQLEAIYSYLGSTDGNLTREQQELFADSFEVYLLDGRSPNQTLGRVFARFRKWMRSLWQEVRRLSNIKINDEIRKTFDEMLGGRSLDFTLQVSGLKMAEGLGHNIPDHVINRAISYLEQGKMSRADMDDLLEKLKTGELAREDFAKELKKFESGNVRHYEQLNPFDKVKYRTALQRGNIKKSDIKEKIDRLLKWSEPRTVNGKLVGRFQNLQLNREFDRIRELMAMPKLDAREKIKENVKLINAIIRGEEVGDADRLAFENKILSVAGGRAEAKILVDVYNAISDSYNMGRLTTAITGQAKKMRKQRLIMEARDVLTDNGRVDVRHEKTAIKQLLNSLGMSQMSWNGLLDILSMNDKSSRTGKSLLNKNLDVFEAEQKEALGVADDGEHFSRLIGEALSGTDNPEISLSRYINTKLKEKFKIEWGLNSKTFTKDQLLDIYMKAQDPETKKIMKEDPILQYNNDFFAAVNDNLTSDDIAVANALFKFYDQNHAKINAFYEDKYGISLPKRNFYSPRSMERGGINVDTGDLTSYAGFSGVKQRTAKAGAVKIKGAFDILNEYIINSNHWIAWSDKLLDINAVFGDVEIKNIIRNIWGNDMERRIGYEVSRFASNDKFQSKFGFGKLFNKIRANYAVSALALKPALAIKQLTSFPAYWEHMSTPDFIAGITDFIAHPKEAIDLLGSTTLMKTRDVNIIKDFEELSKSELIKKKANKVSLREMMMFNIKFGDRGAIYMGGWALYKSELKKNKKAGMSEEEARKKALETFERVTDETQQSGRLSQQSYWQSNPFLRAFTMFQSSQNQYLRKEINAVRGLVTGRTDRKKAAKTLFIFHVLLPCFFQWVADGFRWDKEAQLKAAALGSLNGIFLLNSLLDRMYDWGYGKATGEDIRRGTSSLRVRDVIPFWGSGEDLFKFFDELAEGDVELSDYMDVIRTFGKPAGELSGLPLKYPLDVIQNFGEYSDAGEDAKEVLLYLGWSPYALRNREED